MTKKRLSTVVLAVCILFATSAFGAEGQPSGTVDLSTGSFAVGIGFSWGSGTLKFEGKEYKFKIKGLSILDVGVTSASAVGQVYNLKKVSEFGGTYSAGEAGIAVAGGAGVAQMKNANGVLIKLKSKKQGLQLKLAPEGIKIEMAK